MAIKLIEGFDHLNTTALLSTKGWAFGSAGSGAPAFSSVAGRINGLCSRLSAVNSSGPSASGQSLTKPLPASYTSFVAGFAFRTNRVPATTAEIFVLFESAGGAHVVSVTIGTDGKLRISKTSSGTVLATGTTVIAPDAWNYIEVKALVNGASSTVELHLNGVAEIAAVTVNLGSTGVDKLGPYLIPAEWPASVLYQLDYDDIYILDTTTGTNTTYLGDVHVETLYPSADGSHSAFAPDTGSVHYTQVDDSAPDDDSTYVQSSSVGDVDSYAFADLSVLSGSVFAVQTNLYARKDNSGTRTVAPVVRQAGTDYVGTDAALSTSYADKTQIYDAAPAGGAWTVSAVNNAEFGVKVTT